MSAAKDRFAATDGRHVCMCRQRATGKRGRHRRHARWQKTKGLPRLFPHGQGNGESRRGLRSSGSSRRDLAVRVAEHEATYRRGLRGGTAGSCLLCKNCTPGSGEQTDSAKRGGGPRQGRPQGSRVCSAKSRPGTRRAARIILSFLARRGSK